MTRHVVFNNPQETRYLSYEDVSFQIVLMQSCFVLAGFVIAALNFIGFQIIRERAEQVARKVADMTARETSEELYSRDELEPSLQAQAGTPTVEVRARVTRRKRGMEGENNAGT
ncbi:MAG: hypothetical protein OXC62_05175 [Aestuariivita sp.]|nr:hypothetical protein [Aestuariivita sp.]